VEGQLAMGILRYGQALPLHARIRTPKRGVKTR
jgi:hypothetical protein